MNLFFTIFSYVWIVMLAILYIIWAINSVIDMIISREFIKHFGLAAFEPYTNLFLILNILLIFAASILCFIFMNFK